MAVRVRRVWSYALAAITLSGCASLARAQDADADAGVDSADDERLHPPEIADFIEAEYPAEALRARLQGTVVLKLTVEPDGRVSAAEVVEALGHGFDEAASAAALRFRFRPARRGQRPLTARIPYAYRFQLPPTAAEPPAPPPAPPPARAATPAAPVVEVTVLSLSDAEKKRRSAEAVTVIDTARAKRESADMGEVLARTQGVGVQRRGGLGSTARFSLNGLTDDQVRFFLDGVPLEYAGYPFGIENVPVNLVERIEIYSGVAPVRFGADALGGAVNLVTKQSRRGTHSSASYELGSYDTHRMTASGQYLHADSGLYARANVFVDYAKNNYPIVVDVPDEQGTPRPVRVYRFHDRYRAEGANLELGVSGRPWAKRLTLRGFFTENHKQFQHGLVMGMPYGGVTYGELSGGASLHYEHRLGARLHVDAEAGYAHDRGRYRDVSSCIWDWFGRCQRRRQKPGEISPPGTEQLSWDNSAYVRTQLAWQVTDTQALRLALSPTYLTRTGDELRQMDPSERDSLTAERKLFSMVNGLEHELDLFDDRVENIAFVKQYIQVLSSEEVRPGDVYLRRDRTSQHFGMGDALRIHLTPFLYAKGSYEFATRLPRAEEVFGDNAFVIANLKLKPEISHNGNLGLSLLLREAGLGTLRGSVNGFVRDAKQLIVLVGSERTQTYDNVYSARSLGIESSLGWTSPGDYVVLNGNFTYQSFRNTSTQGGFNLYEGDRIPSRPYMFANGSARVQFTGVAAPRDEVSLSWHTRYVHSFFRGWESLGRRDRKQVVPSQVVHSLVAGYAIRSNSVGITLAIELQNITDAAVFDVFGVQRPGRSLYFKTTAEL